MHTQPPSSHSSGLDRPTLVVRRGRYHRLPTNRELAILHLIGDQVAVPLDQLLFFLGRIFDYDSGEALRVVQALEGTGCLTWRRLLAGDPAWCWLSYRGRIFLKMHGNVRRPQLAHLMHRRALNEVRLFVAARAPEARWISERYLRVGVEPGSRVPDAVVEINGERHALEVELTSKPLREYQYIIADHSSLYDAVVYFCTSHTRPRVERVRRKYSFPKLVIRALSEVSDVFEE